MSKKTEPKEALKVLKDRIHYSLYELNEATKNDTNSRLIRSIRTLDELVDKATPKKPIEDKEYAFKGRMKCECGWGVGDKYLKWTQAPYCSSCSQAIDWSEK